MRKLLISTLALASLLLSPAQAQPAAESIGLEAPTGGWKVSGLTDESEKYQSAYPFNLIDRGRVKGRSLVRGQIHRQGPKPPDDTIVFNGAAIPLFSDDDGRFTRPYAFGRGSNSVEIRSRSNPAVRKRVQFYEAAKDRPQACLRAVLSWDDHQAEVDLHVVTPDGGHAFYADPILANGAGIDPDGVDGPGPEIFTMAAPMHGIYQLWINYWGNFGAEGYHFDESTRQRPVMQARLTIITNENTPAEKQETLVVPLRKVGEMVLAKSLTL
jgi:uncharacterized protein YfaP (DUF2135 family)